MDNREFTDFRKAVDAAFEELDAGRQRQLFVVPTSSRNWRLLNAVRKSSLHSREQLAWASMWEQTSWLHREDREAFLWMRLKELAAEQHSIAKTALHALELSSGALMRSNQSVIPPHGESQASYAGMGDDAYEAEQDHEGWQQGYDY